MLPASEHPLSHPVTKQYCPSDPESSRWVNVLLLALLTLVGAGLRLFHLGWKSLWLDEAASVALARLPWQQPSWDWWRQQGMTAYYLLLRPWLHAGQSEIWIRLPSTLFGIAAVPAMYFLARRLTNNTIALYAAALLAVNPSHVYYSQEARSYSMTVFLVLLSSLFFVRAVQAGRMRDWALWTVFSTVALYSHYFAALVVLAQVVSTLLLPHDKVQWGRLAGYSTTNLVLALPGVSFLVERGPKVERLWIPYPSAKEVVHLWMSLGGSGLKFVLYLALWGVGIGAVVLTWRRQGRSEKSWPGGLILLWALLPIALTIVASLQHSIFAQRYLLVCLPATVMLAALGAGSLPAKQIGMVIVAVICVLSVATDLRSATKPREDWRSATNAILASATAGDAVVFFPSYGHIPFDYYHDRHLKTAPDLHIFAPEIYGPGEDERNLLRAISSNPHQFRHVWVILYNPGPQRNDLGDLSPALSATLQSLFGAPKLRQFASITLLQFGSDN